MPSSFQWILSDEKMAENTKAHLITIDLDQFKLHINFKRGVELTLHFNSPSRRFYLSVIAFVVSEMKREGKISSIPLEGNYELLVLLNDTVGGSAGSSKKENLLLRIYRKWKDALPNLEEAPLFKVLGKTKKYDEGAAKAYAFSEVEKDNWYHPDTDSLYIDLSERPSAEGREVSDGVVLETTTSMGDWSASTSTTQATRSSSSGSS
jgi:Protein of unknown function (DUF2283)